MNKFALLKAKYPDRVPVVVEGINLDRTKYLVPMDFTVGQFVYVLRRKLQLKPDEAIYCLIKMKKCSVIPKCSDYLWIYEENDYVRILINFENSFG